MQIMLNTSFHITKDGGTRQEARAYTAQQVEAWIKHNHRKYGARGKCYSKIDKKRSGDNKSYLDKGTFVPWFNKWFADSYARHNAKQEEKLANGEIKKLKSSRKLGTGYEKYVGSINGQAVAEQIVISLGNEEAFADFWYMKERNEWRELWHEWGGDVLKFLQHEIPEFKVYDAVLHMDETSPHMHIIGTPIIKHNGKVGPDVVISKSKVFDRVRMKELHVKLREFNQGMADKLSDLAKELGYVAKKNVLKRVTKAKWNDRRVEFVAAKENVGRKKGISERSLHDAVELIENNKLSKSERKILMSALKMSEGLELKRSEGMDKYVQPELKKLRDEETWALMKKQSELNEVKIKLSAKKAELAKLKAKYEPEYVPQAKKPEMGPKKGLLAAVDVIEIEAEATPAKKVDLSRGM